MPGRCARSFPAGPAVFHPHRWRHSAAAPGASFPRLSSPPACGPQQLQTGLRTLHQILQACKARYPVHAKIIAAACLPGPGLDGAAPRLPTLAQPASRRIPMRAASWARLRRGAQRASRSAWLAFWRRPPFHRLGGARRSSVSPTPCAGIVVPASSPFLWQDRFPSRVSSRYLLAQPTPTATGGLQLPAHARILAGSAQRRISAGPHPAARV